jgi:hypothetical protein
MKHAPSQQPVTTLSGELSDQAALMGVLNALYDMGFPLLRVERFGPPPSAEGPSRGDETIWECAHVLAAIPLSVDIRKGRMPALRVMLAPGILTS